jgi:hypothetical protein
LTIVLKLKLKTLLPSEHASLTDIRFWEQTETPINLNQSESPHYEPTNDHHRRAAFLKHTTSNMESTSPKKARTDV